MDQSLDNNRFQPGYYISSVVDGIMAVVNSDGTGSIRYKNKVFCDLDLANNRITFKEKTPRTIPILNEFNPEQTVLMAIDLAETYSRITLGADYTEEFKLEIFDKKFPQELLEYVDLHIGKADTPYGETEAVIMHMKDSEADVSFAFFRDKDIDPILVVTKPGDGEYYSNKGIIKIDKEKEEEFGKAISYLYHIPVEVIGKKTHDWIREVYELSEDIINRFEESNYEEAVEVNVDLGYRTEPLTIDAVIFDDAAEELAPSEIMGYIVSGPLEERFYGNKENLYELAIKIIATERQAYRIMELVPYFKDNLYPYAHKLYYQDAYETLPEDVKQNFQKFQTKYYEIMGYSPYIASSNECLRIILSEGDECSKQIEKLRGMLEECREYMYLVSSGIVPELAVNTLSTRSIERQIREIHGRYRMLPEEMRPEFCTSESIDAIRKSMVDMTFTHSKLMTGLHIEPSDENFFVHNDMEIRSRIDTLWLTNPEAEKEAYVRSDFESKTGLTYEEALANGEDFELWTFTYLDGSVKMEMINNDYISADIHLSQDEQVVLNNKLEECIGTDIESHIAEHLSKHSINTINVYGAKLASDGKSITVHPELDNNALDEALKRSNGYAVFGVEDLHDFIKQGYQKNVEATLLPDGDVKLSIPGGHNGLVAEVPLTHDEKQSIKDSFQEEYKMSEKEFVDRHNSKDNLPGDKKNLKRNEPGLG